MAAPTHKAIALWDYTAQEVEIFNQNNEISFKAGDMVDVLDLCNEDWYEGIIDGKSGFFPANHVEIVQAQPLQTKNTSATKIIANSAEEMEPEDSLAINWHLVITDAGVKYFWNSETGETSWEVPDGIDVDFTSAISEIKIADAGSPGTGNNRFADRIEYVPPELIRREGPMGFKAKKDYGGIEPKKQHSWHNYWAVICAGHLLFYKDDPLKMIKKGEKNVKPVHVLYLEQIEVKREAKDAGKKNVILVQSKSGAIIILQPPESETNEWYQTIVDNTKEECPPGIYEKVLSTLKTSTLPTTANLNEVVKQRKGYSRTESNLKESIGSRKSNKSKESGEETEETKASVKTKFNNFFKRVQGELTGDKGASKEKELIRDDVVFGGTLLGLVNSNGNNVPTFLIKCIVHIEEYGLKSQGIYRLSGNASTVQQFRTQINQGKWEIQVPVIPFEMYDAFMEVMKMEDYNDRLCEIKTLVQSLPKPHYDVLEYLLRHLAKVASYSDINKMEPTNLAIVFGPSLIRKPENGAIDMQAAMANMINMSFQNSLVEAMIVQTEWLFDGNPN